MRYVYQFVVVVLVLVALVTNQSRADMFGFGAISENSGVQDALAQQLSVEVTPYGTDDDQVLFTFGNYLTDPYNTGTLVPGEIGSVFFEDGALLGIATVLNSPGDVEFSVPSHPDAKNLPDSGDLDTPFYTSAHFWATMDNGGLGVDPTESLGIVFNLKDGYGFADVISAIHLGFDSPNPSAAPLGVYDPSVPPTLRIGVHVQSLGLGGEESDSFLLVPVPGAMLLGSLGLGSASYLLRRKKQNLPES